MTQSGQTQRRISWGFIFTAVLLLLGVILMAAGNFCCGRPALYVGLLMTLAGVMLGIQQLFTRGGSRKAGQ